MRLMRLKGVKDDTKGTTYQVVVVDENGLTISDNKAPTYLEFAEQGTAPAAPAANSVRLFAEDNGSGKTRIVAKFASGADVVLGTQA